MTEPSEAQIDALKEVGNIGASHASDVLGQMMGKTVIINVPQAMFLPVEKISKIFGLDDDIIIILFFMIEGDVEGYMVISFSESQATLISNHLMGTNDEKLDLTEEKKSAIKEVGNILASAYLTAMSDLAGFSLRPSVPYLTHDTVEAVVNPIITDMSETAEYALITDNEFLLEGKAIAGKCITFYDRESFTKILKALGMDA